mgnify:CR=1 FL=1
MVKINNVEKIIALLVLALFSNLRFQTDFAVLRLFDALTLFFFVYFFFKNLQSENQSKGYLYILPFFFFHVMMSHKLGLLNLLREFIQITLICFFLYIIIKSREFINFKNLMKYILISTALIIFYTISWHIYNGYLVGWKSLADTRIAYSFFTVIFFIYFNLSKKNKSPVFLFFSVILFLILILSGERKAIAIFIFLFLLNYFKGIGIKSFIMLSILYFGFSISSSYITNSYIKNKIDTTLNLMNTGNFNYVLQTGNISREDTYSNAQRAFSLEISKELIKNNFLMGIGTNNYEVVVNQDYNYLPKFMKLGIHGEFQRVLVENGIIGFIFYIFIWIKSWSRLKVVIKNLKINNKIYLPDINFLMLSIFVPAAFYIGTEASSTRSFILIGILSVLPDLIEAKIKKTNDSK